MKDKILNWLGTGRVGSSSKAMALAVADVESNETSHPYDPDDLNRCLLFLETVPEARQHFDKVAALSGKWEKLINRWDEVEKCFLDEVGLNPRNGSSAPKTYNLMEDVYE